MKYLIASDIHGSAFWCRKLLERFHAEGADRLILLGDLLYHGPRNDLPQGYAPKEVISLLNPLSDRILAVRGNCDAEVDQMVLTFPLLADYAVLCERGKLLYLAHGHRDLPPLRAGDLLLNGHFHVPKCEERGHYTYLNCGSVSLPKEQSPHSYLVLDGGVFTWKDLDGNPFLTHTL